MIFGVSTTASYLQESSPYLLVSAYPPSQPQSSLIAYHDYLPTVMAMPFTPEQMAFLEATFGTGSAPSGSQATPGTSRVPSSTPGQAAAASPLTVTGAAPNQTPYSMRARGRLGLRLQGTRACMSEYAGVHVVQSTTMCHGIHWITVH